MATYSGQFRPVSICNPQQRPSAISTQRHSVAQSYQVTTEKTRMIHTRLILGRSTQALINSIRPVPYTYKNGEVIFHSITPEYWIMPPSDFCESRYRRGRCRTNHRRSYSSNRWCRILVYDPVERLGVPAIKVIFSFIFSSNAIDWHPSRLAMVQMASEETISSWERQPNACRFVRTSITTFSPWKASGHYH